MEKFITAENDVAKALGYVKPRDAIKRHCKGVVKHNVSHPQNPTKQIEMSFIPEGDVYRLIVRSKLPKAKEFESLIFDTALHSINHNGAYIANQENMSDEEIMAHGIMAAQNYLRKVTEDRNTKNGKEK